MQLALLSVRFYSVIQFFVAKSKITELKLVTSISLNVSRQLDIVVSMPIVTRTLYEIYKGHISSIGLLDCLHNKGMILVQYVLLLLAI